MLFYRRNLYFPNNESSSYNYIRVGTLCKTQFKIERGVIGNTRFLTPLTIAMNIFFFTV